MVLAFSYCEGGRGGGMKEGEENLRRGGGMGEGDRGEARERGGREE